MILAISDGTTTHTLHSANLETGKATSFVQEHWAPTPPKITALEVTSVARDGGEMSKLSRANVYERAACVLLGTETQIREHIRNIEAAMGEAANHATTGEGSPWHVYYDPTATAIENAYRSQILYGTVTVESTDFNNGIAVVDIGWKRRFYWEGALTELTLVNGHGSGTDGKIVYNTDDATYDDWVTITGAQVTGSLPTPIRVEYTNRYTTTRLQSLHTGLAVWGGLDHDVVHITFASADNYTNPFTPTTETRIAWWEIATADLDTLSGQYYRVLMQCGGYPTAGTWLRPRIQIPGDSPLTTVYEGDRVLLDSNWLSHDLGVIQLPPWLVGQSDLQSVALSLYAENPASGDKYMTGSYLKLLPASTFRKLTPAGYGSLVDTRIVDDQIVDLLWNDYPDGTAKTGHYYPWGGKQYLWPGKPATFYVKASTGSNYVSTMSGELKIHFRPRRLSL